MIIWRGEEGDLKPVPMECESFGWPHKTKCGEKMFDNTHFKTIEEAWESIKRSWAAAVNLSFRDVQSSRVVYERSIKRYNDDLKKQNICFKNYNAWLLNK